MIARLTLSNWHRLNWRPNRAGQSLANSD